MASRAQRVVLLRHGDRIDHADPTWASGSPRPWDPPLIATGLARAWATGKRLRAEAEAAGWRVDRVLVSPFVRCLQTASEAVAAFCAAVDVTALETSAGVVIDPSRIKVSIECGLSEMMNAPAMGGLVSRMAPKIQKWFPDLSELEAVLPAGTIDHSVVPLYQEVPKWGESVLEARSRYANVIKALADRYPEENLCLVTHGECVGASVTYFEMGTEVYEVEYCAYSVLERQVAIKIGEGFTAEDFKLTTDSGTTGLLYTVASEREKFSTICG